MVSLLLPAYLCVPSPLTELGSTVVRTRWPTGAGVLFDRFSLIVRLYFQQCQLPRRNGSPGVSSGYFQRTIVRYTEFDHMTDRGLCPVLRTRPGLAPPQICLPSTLPGTVRRPTLLPPGWTLPAVALTFGEPSASLRLQAHIAATPLPSAILPLRQGGSGLCLAFVS